MKKFDRKVNMVDFSMPTFLQRNAEKSDIVAVLVVWKSLFLVKFHH